MMKRLIACLLALACLIGAGLAEGASGGWVLREGKYIVGEDIPAGSYTLTCTGTAGEQLNDAYGSLGSTFDALGGGSEMNALFGMLGGMAENWVDMSVNILGGYGDVLKSYSLKNGESIYLTLKPNTALQISDGSCTVQPVR